MEIFTIANASDTIDLFLGFITSNIDGIVIILGTVTGIRYFRQLFNSAQDGKFDASESGNYDIGDYEGSDYDRAHDIAFEDGDEDGFFAAYPTEESYNRAHSKNDYGQSAIDEYEKVSKENKRLRNEL